MSGLYHGGPAGLDRILPPSKTGARSQSEFGNHLARTDRVYVTPSLKHAYAFAMFAPCEGNSAVYEVEPIGELEHDPDCNVEGGSFACLSASIIRVVHTIEQDKRTWLTEDCFPRRSEAELKRNRKRKARLARIERGGVP